MILGPGMYPGVPFADYLAQPAVSAGLLKVIVNECPRAAWFESWLNPARTPDNSHASDVGSIAHAILLEGSTAGVAVIDPENYPSKTGTVPAGWTTKDIRAARDDARAVGKIPVLLPDMLLIENMVDSARHYIDGLKDSEPAIYAAFQPDGGASEQTCIWQEDGMTCRMRPDRLANDRKLIVDIKTTQRSAEPALWSRTQMGPLGYWISASWYRRGCQRVFGQAPEYRFLVIQQDSPHLCSLVGVDPAGFDHGGMQVEYGLRVWRDCMARSYWPGYPARTVFPEVMPWDLARAQEQYGVDESGIPYDPAVLYGEREPA